MGPKRVAAIDCGTNTFNLLIAEQRGSGIKVLCKRKRSVKLGSEGFKNRMIGPLAEARAIAAIQFFSLLIDRYKVAEVRAVGTSALRDAKNGAQIIRKIEALTAVPIQLIDGLTEAKTIYSGVRNAIPLGTATNLIMDIGGGSTEFILCNSKRVFWKKSYRLGVARLTELIQPHEPINKKEIAVLETHLEKELRSLIAAANKFRPVRLIGSSGSFETFAAILLKKEGKKPGRRTQYQFNLKDFHRLHKELIASTYKERLAIPGMLRMRAELIIYASLLLTFVLRKLKVKELHLSTYALREGLLFNLLNETC